MFFNSDFSEVPLNLQDNLHSPFNKRRPSSFERIEHYSSDSVQPIDEAIAGGLDVYRKSAGACCFEVCGESPENGASCSELLMSEIERDDLEFMKMQPSEFEMQESDSEKQVNKWIQSIVVYLDQEEHNIRPFKFKKQLNYEAECLGNYAISSAKDSCCNVQQTQS
ncbi:hypothetical protein FGO68_gene354 [Halteria grandinella]|uniref:Uncharacterized protein n=1 Tax=Halteria grandinella TaxID=5974 RepID=A0A8J8NR30_HALGN|nr:hypothetical protein FGO68_gene354 [Halteria grandinella]